MGIKLLLSHLLNFQACQMIVCLSATFTEIYHIRYQMMLRGNHLIAIQKQQIKFEQKLQKNYINYIKNNKFNFYLTFYRIYCFNSDMQCENNC